jgi:hypothetical protein
MDTAVLRKFWQRILRNQSGTADTGEWNEQVSSIYACGKGLEETIRFLYHQQPSFETFIDWIKPEEENEISYIFSEDILTQNELNYFKENGFIVIRNAICSEHSEDAKRAILEYLKADLNDPSTWYKDHEELRGLMLMLYHHPALEVIRNSSKIRKAYEQLYGTTQIHKVIEKVSFNPPETSFYKFRGSPLHWDVSLVLPIPFKLQGLLYLNDVDENGGAFLCVPGFHNQLEGWLNNLSPGINPRDAAVLQLKPQPVTGKAGDFIIWHQALPHCASPNHSNTPRFVQYHTYDPDGLIVQEVWR